MVIILFNFSINACPLGTPATQGPKTYKYPCGTAWFTGEMAEPSKMGATLKSGYFKFLTLGKSLTIQLVLLSLELGLHLKMV